LRTELILTFFIYQLVEAAQQSVENATKSKAGNITITEAKMILGLDKVPKPTIEQITKVSANLLNSQVQC
jgi:hypothetical protein